MPIPMNELLEAYKAIHVIRRFADDHASELSFIVTMASGDCVNPVAILHDTIQDETYSRWKALGRTPFMHKGQIVYWDSVRQKLAFTDPVQSHDLAG
jgi:hypothetical protein